MSDRSAVLRALLVVCLALLLPHSAAAQAASLEWLDEPYGFETPDGQVVAARAGWLDVPVRHGDPAGPTYRLRVVVLPSTDTGSVAPPVLYLAGGPGGSSISAVRDEEDLWDILRPLRGHAPIVLMDQRGAGRSEPSTRCTPEIALTPEIFADYVRMLARERTIVRSCAEHWRSEGLEPGTLNTYESALDIADLSRALGTPLSLLGFSYGTHLAITAMRVVPEVVARVVLVGVEGPDDTFKLPSNLDGQIERLAAFAAADPVVGPQVPDFAGLLRETLQRLETDPVEVRVEGRDDEAVTLPVTDDMLRLLLRLDLGDGYDFPVFPAMLAELQQGRTDHLAGFAGRRYRQFSGAIGLMPDLMDCASGASPGRLDRILAERPGSFIAASTDLFHPEACDALDVERLPAAHREPLRSHHPTLLVSGGLDANTPPFQAETVAWGLPNASHVVLAHSGHENTLGDPDVRDRIIRFLRGEAVPGEFLDRPAPRFIPVWPPATEADPDPPLPDGPIPLLFLEFDGDRVDVVLDFTARTVTLLDSELPPARIVETSAADSALYLVAEFDGFALRMRLEDWMESPNGLFWFGNRPGGEVVRR